MNSSILGCEYEPLTVGEFSFRYSTKNLSESSFSKANNMGLVHLIIAGSMTLLQSTRLPLVAANCLDASLALYGALGAGSS